jgi:hypothetical protein
VKPTPLLVFVVVASCALAQPASPQAAAPGAWHQSQKSDPAGTYTFTRFSVEGRFLGSAPASAHPALTVDCIPGAESRRNKGKFLVAALLVGTPLTVDYVEPEEIRGTSYYPKVAVSYRTDGSGDEVQENWALGTDRVPNPAPADKTAASIPKNALSKILQAHSVTFTVNDSHGSPLKMQFDLPGAAPLEAVCNLEE